MGMQERVGLGGKKQWREGGRERETKLFRVPTPENIVGLKKMNSQLSSYGQKP